jgi:hypothetical protein
MSKLTIRILVKTVAADRICHCGSPARACVAAGEHGLRAQPDTSCAFRLYTRLWSYSVLVSRISRMTYVVLFCDSW